jgi:hypothetical protein
MCPARLKPLLYNWETTRYELLKMRVRDLGVTIEGSPLEPAVVRVRRELAAKGFKFQPCFYLSDSWGCPDEVPAVGIPFYLADARLRRLEEEQTGEIESEASVLMYLRHEAGHAINYAYRLWTEPGWTEVFGSFTRPYRDSFRPNPMSRAFVRHLVHSNLGRTYAQKHPDEDFAETFAVWLTPRSAWRQRYRDWPVLKKLRYVDQLMRRIRGRKPRKTGGRLVNPVEELGMLLADHYGQRAERYRALAQGYVDDRLREVFPPVVGAPGAPVVDLLRRHHLRLASRMARWSGLQEPEAEGILTKLEDRARVLQLTYRRQDTTGKLMDISGLAASLAMDFVYTGRLTG